jgi:hypothetical protein
MEVDVENIKSPEAKAFWDQFIVNRNINRDYYQAVSSDKLDFRMVDTPNTKSDSPRESIAHKIYVTRKYIYGVKTGILNFDGIVNNPIDHPEQMTKQDLLDELDKSTQELASLLREPDVASRMVQVPWSENPITAVQTLYGLDSHEVLHTGWNLAVMDHLDIKRFLSLKEIWG